LSRELRPEGGAKIAVSSHECKNRLMLSTEDTGGTESIEGTRGKLRESELPYDEFGGKKLFPRNKLI